MFTVPSAMNVHALTSSDFFPMNTIVIDFDGIVVLIDSLKRSSPCGVDNNNTKFLRNTKFI